MNWQSALRLALAEMRRSGGKLAFCIFAIAVGVAALTAVRTAIESLEEAVARQSRSLMGADLSLESNAPLQSTASGASMLRDLQSRGARFADLIEFNSMLLAPARSGAGADLARLARVRAISDAFPFYGRIETRPAGAWQALQRRSERGLIADPQLEAALSLRPGQKLMLGKAEFVYLGSFLKTPGSPASGVGIAPVVYIASAHLAETGLVQTGSRIRYRKLVLAPAALDVLDWKERNWEAASQSYIEIESYREAVSGLQRFLARLSSFLSISGMITLLLGGLGIGSAMTVFIKDRLDHAAILRSMGARPGDVFRIYLLLAMMLGAIGSLLGVIPGALFAGALEWLARSELVRGMLPIELHASFSWRACVEGALAGLIATFVFTLLPVYRIRSVSPLRVLRRSDEKTALQWRDWLVYGLGGAGLTAAVALLTITQTRSLWASLYFCGAVLTAVALLFALAQAAMRLTRLFLPRIRSYLIRQGAANLYRPGNQTSAVIVATGLGALLLATVFIFEASFQKEIALSVDQNRPNLFVIDIQPDQRENFERWSAAQPSVSRFSIAPMVTARIKAINGRPIDVVHVERDSVQRSWEDRARTREYFLSYREQLIASETVVAGRFWSGRPPTQEVSLDEQWAKTMDVDLGDVLTFDIQGLPLDAKITSLRDVQWQSMQPNTMVLLSPGEIEYAPRVYMASFRAATPGDVIRLQAEAARRFPNLTIIDVTEAANQLGAILGTISAVLQFLALLTALNGVVILAGAIAAGRFARLRESMLLKTLGASFRDLNIILATEYALLATLGVFAGWILAEGLNRALLSYLFHASAAPPYATLLLLGLAIIALNTLTGLAISRDVARARPLQILREE
ncbi:MAG: FtsX-like permease family protein [Leptospirales bacterium]|nr:FtsX-like permease family protein [Leptospirales bacterium]